MKKNTYKWKIRDVLKEYFNCLKEIRKTKDKNKLLELYLDKQYLEDMIFFTILKFPDIITLQNFKDDITFDRDFISMGTTKYQQENIKFFIKKSLDSKFKLIETIPNNINGNLIKESCTFLHKIDAQLEKELTNSINNHHIYLYNNKFSKNYAGTTYSLKDINYYEICTNTLANNLITLNHELVHGYINKVTNRKFDKENKIVLYKEVASLLIEFYSNDYLNKNNLITSEEYISNFNGFFITNAYYSIEIIDTLYEMAKDDKFIINKENINKFIDNKRKLNENYNFDIKELTQFPLKHHLIYLYSYMIALGIYYNYKNEPQEGIKVAFDVIKKINEENEEELLNSYNIDPISSFNKYIDENNELIKKMNN